MISFAFYAGALVMLYGFVFSDIEFYTFFFEFEYRILLILVYMSFGKYCIPVSQE